MERSYNDLTIDATGPYASDPDRLSDLFAASLVLSLIFHPEVVFLDTHLINNLALRHVCRRRPNIRECLQQAGVVVALRKGTASLGGLMQAMQGERRYNVDVFSDEHPYESYESPAEHFEHLVRPSHAYDVSTLGDRFTELVLQTFADAQPILGASSGRGGEARRFLQLLRELARERGTLTQKDFQFFQGDSPLVQRLQPRGLATYARDFETQIFDLQVFCYRTTSSRAFEMGSIFHPGIDGTARMIRGCTDGRERRIPLSSRYFYTDNLCRLRPDVLARIRSTPEAREFFADRAEGVGARALEARIAIATRYIRATEAILAGQSGVLGLRAGQDRWMRLIVRLGKAASGAAGRLEAWADPVKEGAEHLTRDAGSESAPNVEAVLQIDLGAGVALPVDLKDIFTGPLEALNVLAQMTTSISHASTLYAASLHQALERASQRRLRESLWATLDASSRDTTISHS